MTFWGEMRRNLFSLQGASMRKLIFSAPVTRGALMEFLALGNWTYTHEYEPDDYADNSVEIEWTQNEGTRKVTFYDDAATRLQYLALEGAGDDDESLESDVRRGPFQFESTEGILAAFDRAQSPDQAVDAFAKLVIVAPETADERFLRRIERALMHPSPTVRTECLDLLSYVSWHEILPLVTRLRSDPDGTVRHTASVIADEFKALVLG
jgi:hypothetical protein